MNREIEINSTIRIIVLSFAAVTAGMTLWACVDHQMMYAAVGLIAFLIGIVPFLFLKSYDLFSPWSFVLLAIGMGCTLQCLCMSFMWPNAEAIERLLILGQPPEYFIYPAGLYLLGIICLTAGYFANRRSRHWKLNIKREYSNNNLIIVLGACLVVSVVATLAFVRFTGGVQSGKISAKRTTIKTLDVQRDDGFRQYGSLRHMGKLANVAFLILYSFFLARNPKLTTMQWALVGGSFLVACALPFYMSLRGQVCWVILSALGVTYYHGRGNFVMKFGIYAALSIALFVFMSILRHAGDDDAMSKLTIEDSISSLILNRNGPGLSKTAHIINHIPDTLEFKYGETIAVWVIAPIPRELYPNKPMVHTGPIIGTRIYGNRVSGVPPGLVAELYWNFYIPGIIFGMLTVGWVLHAVYMLFRNCNVDPTIVSPIYLFAIIPVGFAIIGHSLGFGTIMRFVDFATIGVVVFFCTRQRSD
ncbi:MAG: O-antigen polymerase [Planctomycetota bacterium]